ncbi:MAG TPA: D-alanyl-D-alanine carboxypeptidase [Patescibacteria group bacterium]|nr:D-alanyl-D-alanine carboxypeptidase [Patescibacteria group bacterium]
MQFTRKNKPLNKKTHNKQKTVIQKETVKHQEQNEKKKQVKNDTPSAQSVSKDSRFIHIRKGYISSTHVVGKIFCFFCVSLAILLFLVTKILQQQAQVNTPLPDPFPAFNFASYPVVSNAFIPQVSANGAYVLDITSGVPIFTKNASVRFSPASTTKMMTALTALAYFKPQAILTVQRNYVEGSGLHFYKGEQFHFIDLLYAMFLPSANDAADAIADNYPGGIDAFVKKMDENVTLFGLFDTHFIDPAGLEDDGDYTSPHDLAIIASHVMQNTLLSRIVDTKIKTIFSLQGDVYPIKNLNQLLGYEGVNGVKTGTTDEAGEVLVTSAVQHTHQYILVIMKSNDRFSDTEKLLLLITDNVTYLSIHP